MSFYNKQRSRKHVHEQSTSDEWSHVETQARRSSCSKKQRRASIQRQRRKKACLSIVLFASVLMFLGLYVELHQTITPTDNASVQKGGMAPDELGLDMHQQSRTNNESSLEQGSQQDLSSKAVQTINQAVISQQNLSFAVSSQELNEVAKSVLMAYGAQKDCFVFQHGYLDLFGRVWSCVIQGNTWVDICVISRKEDGCSVSKQRFNSALWQEDFMRADKP